MQPIYLQNASPLVSKYRNCLNSFCTKKMNTYFLAIMKKSCYKYPYTDFCIDVKFLIPFGKYQETQILDLMVRTCFIFITNWQNSPVNPPGPATFHFWRLLIVYSLSLINIGLLKLSTSCMSFVRLNFSRNWSISFRLSNNGHIIVHYISLNFHGICSNIPSSISDYL